MPASDQHISPFTKSEIATIFKQARRCLKHSGLDILLNPKMHDAGRILIVASAKVGNAVKRNKIRRRLKALFYEKKLMDQAYDCFVIIKKEGIELSFDELSALLEKAYTNSLNFFKNCHVRESALK